ncbi:MAG: indole-3-glycerol phosphate synthase TrpC [Gammaproteobacteria bacterium]|nr:indole-3-glycerol phosphate synthase TrpC [Gammaproteobacteria bacterium]
MSKATILEDIIAQKYREIVQDSQRTSLVELERAAAKISDKREFIGSLRTRIVAHKPAVIAEIKKASPSKGLIREDFDPVTIARQYEAAGATCLSVLTDREFFQGGNEYLQQARSACTLPVIRKDFMVDRYQIAEAKALGADCVLLIVAALTPEKLRELASYAQSINIDVLVEVHDEIELEIALATGFDLIGINNRNLHTFETSLETTYRLAELTPHGKLLVTESGINTAEDVTQMIAHGIYGFLIGETFMRAPQPGDKLRELFAAHE